MDGLVISTNLKLNNFTHFDGLNGTLQSTEQNHRPSASELGFTAGAQGRYTTELAQQTCAILSLVMLQGSCVCSKPVRRTGRSRKQSRSTDSCAIHGFLRNVWIHRLRSAIHGLRRSTDCAQHINYICNIHIPIRKFPYAVNI